jgi:hypothetical protein
VLEDLQLDRLGNLVTAQWLGSPKFSVGVLSTLSDSEAFDRAADALASQSTRPGFSPPEIQACIAELRARATELRKSFPQA